MDVLNSRVYKNPWLVAQIKQAVYFTILVGHQPEEVTQQLAIRDHPIIYQSTHDTQTQHWHEMSRRH